MKSQGRGAASSHKLIRRFFIIFRLVAIFAFMTTALSCSAQKTFSEVASIKGVNSVYIGKAMLRLAGAMDMNAASGVMDMSKLAGKLTSIEVINCEDKKAVKEALPVAERILSQFPWEIISVVKDDGTSVEISGVFKEDGETITMLLIKCVEDDDELTLILLKGEIDMETLQTALQQ